MTAWRGCAATWRLLVVLATIWLFLSPASAAQSGFSDNAQSVAVIVGNQKYRQTSPVDFAGNDADAMKDFLIRGLGFEERNVFVLKDATLNELNQAFGTEANPTNGKLWRSAVAGKSNVFVYYSGHGVPDLKTRQPFLLPQDGDPNFAESGYPLETLYRNLELVKQKIGPDRQVIVMVDACFTGETGRKGENMLAVSAPGFAPAKPKAPGGVIRLAATSGATPANWDQNAKLGLFTSRFLMGAAGLAEPGPAKGATSWADLQAYVMREVESAARRDVGREQKPEIDAAPFSLPAVEPGPAIRQAVERARDEQGWRDAESDGSRAALERYVARCSGPCAYRSQAMSKLLNKNRGDEAQKDDEIWGRMSAEGKYQDYLDNCNRTGNRVCAYRQLALGYLGKDPTQDAGGRAQGLAPPQGSQEQPVARQEPPQGQGSIGSGRSTIGLLQPAGRERVSVDQLPDRKAGLWEVSGGAGGAMNGTRECVGPGSEEAARKSAANVCASQAFYRTPRGYEIESDCRTGGIVAKARGFVTGDFVTTLRTEISTTMTGVPGQKAAASSRMVIDTRRIGDCLPGQRVGDVIMPNGKVVRNTTR